MVGHPDAATRFVYVAVGAWCRATTETVDISIKLYYDPYRERRFAFQKELPHTIR
jgi:hypothetical protein